MNMNIKNHLSIAQYITYISMLVLIISVFLPLSTLAQSSIQERDACNKYKNKNNNSACSAGYRKAVKEGTVASANCKDSTKDACLTGARAGKIVYQQAQAQSPSAPSAGGGASGGSAGGSASGGSVQNLSDSGACEQESTFTLLPSWHRYLKKEPVESTQSCEVEFTLMEGGKFNGGDMLLVGVAIIEILLRIAGIVAVAFVMIGGIRFMTSQGSPDGAKSAQNTILNAILGAVIAIIAAAVVAYIGRTLK